MTRKLPLIPTIVVAVAVAVMIGLGVWQLQRAGEKQKLLQRYAEAEKLPPIAFPTLPMSDARLPLFRQAAAEHYARAAVASRTRAAGAISG